MSIPSNLDINWNHRENGTTYTKQQAESDFGNVSGWQNAKAYISTEQCRITLLPKALSGAGGLVADIDIEDGSAYELNFNFKFHADFDFSKGGKLGFGFRIGDGNAGGNPGSDGNGGSARVTWYTNNQQRTYLRAYVYHYDQPGKYGDTFGSFPAAESLQKNQWYAVYMYVKSNTDDNVDGHITVKVDDQMLVDQVIRWSPYEGKRAIKKLTFHTFRGGAESDWESDTVGYIYFDNLKLKKLT